MANQVDYSQPVAYDTEGRPLYYRAENTDDFANQTTSSNQDFATSPTLSRENLTLSNPIDDSRNQSSNSKHRAPKIQKNQIILTNIKNIKNVNSGQTSSLPISPEVQAKHTDSVKQFPILNLSPEEYVVISVRRSVVGLIEIWLTALGVFAAVVIGAFLIQTTSPFAFLTTFNVPLVGLAMAVICCLGGILATWVFYANYFIVSNLRIFSRTQFSPFAHRSQVVEVEHVGDISFRQTNIFQTIFNYGSIYLSIIGDKNTYRFSFAANPAEQMDVINSVINQSDKNESAHNREQGLG